MKYGKATQIGTKKPTRTRINVKANKELDKLWKKKGINYCEICGGRFRLTNMHRHKRIWFYDKPNHYLWDYKYCIRACLKCHMKLEHNKKETEKMFKKLRRLV